ncbi:hypothetical protein [uncultured Cetobacterium sp.]|uniref:hypothetical protein n=1 Tax=uncultured Cetobacterium sp. TaxID=527638 RepID=UPI0025F0DC31|nr:hypothetical protein [uncultured Cetobacterium sp.]
MIEILKNNLEILISIIAIIISGLTIYFQQKHNKNSVKPLGGIIIEDYENKISIKIVNSGVGPLIVKELICKFDDEESTSILIELLKETLENRYVNNFVEDIVNRVISPNGKIVLFEIKNNLLDDEIKQKLRKKLSNITIELRYKNIYNENFSVRRKLDFFGRHSKKCNRVMDYKKI